MDQKKGAIEQAIADLKLPIFYLFALFAKKHLFSSHVQNFFFRIHGKCSPWEQEAGGGGEAGPGLAWRLLGHPRPGDDDDADDDDNNDNNNGQFCSVHHPRLQCCLDRDDRWVNTI